MKLVARKSKKITLDQFVEKITNLKEDESFRETVIKKGVVPKLKEKMQKQIDEDIIKKDFVDSKGRYRRYWQNFKNGRAIKDKNGNLRTNLGVELGRGRTQATSYKKMANDEYFVIELSSKGNFVEHIEIYNNFPVGKSIFNTPIINKSDLHLYTQWLVEGDIVMPTLKKMSKSEWQVYCKDPANRYKARPYVDNLADRLSTMSPDREEIQKATTDEVSRQIVKYFRK